METRGMRQVRCECCAILDEKCDRSGTPEEMVEVLWIPAHKRKGIRGPMKWTSDRTWRLMIHPECHKVLADGWMQRLNRFNTAERLARTFPSSLSFGNTAGHNVIVAAMQRDARVVPHPTIPDRMAWVFPDGSAVVTAGERWGVRPDKCTGWCLGECECAAPGTAEAEAETEALAEAMAEAALAAVMAE